MMKKMYCFFFLVTSLFASFFSDDELESYRNGFIAAYKAMRVDAEIQGINSKVLDIKDYIIYFDASDKMISNYDRLMVQMFGYLPSVRRPIRTVENFIVFDSYDDYTTALGKMEILNKKIFRNSKKYKLKIFDNSTKKRKFYNDRALLIDCLKELEALLRKNNEIKLVKKQKVAKNSSKIDKNTFIAEKFYGKPKKESVMAFYRPTYNMKYKKDKISQKDILEFESKNGYGWFKVKNKRLYLQGHLIDIVKKSKSIKTNKKSKLSSIKKSIVSPKVIKKTIPKKIKKGKKKEDKKLFTLMEKEVVVFQLNDTYKENKNIYEVKYFHAKGTMENNYSRIEYTSIVSDTDGNKYIKLKNKNAYIKFKNAYIIK